VPPPPPPNKTLQWALRAAGLVVIAVVSGLIWYYITNDSTSTPDNGAEESGTQEPEDLYQFTAYKDMPDPDRVTDCAEHAYDATETFLKNTPCDHLTRQLFVTEVNDGKGGKRTVYTSVSVVVMPDEDKANQLRQLTDIDGKGNINDVVRDGVVTIDGLKSLSANDGYKSKQTGREVVIVESDFAPGDKSGKGSDQEVLDEVCEYALLLAAQVDAGSGN
jgi:hypothetical protein